MAAAWAVLNYLGDEGYLEIVREVMAATQKLIDGINRIDGVRILGRPDMCMFALTSDSEKINVYRLADEMKLKGWYLQPQFARENSPANLHISMNRSSVPQAEAFLETFEETIEEMKQQEIDDDTGNLYAELDNLSINYDEATFFKLAEMVGVTADQLPQRMEKINKLLEVLPYDVSEFMLVEFLNNLMVAARQ